MKIGIFGPKMACRAQKKPENFGKPLNHPLAVENHWNQLVYALSH